MKRIEAGDRVSVMWYENADAYRRQGGVVSRVGGWWDRWYAVDLDEGADGDRPVGYYRRRHMRRI